jgi:hypothetical protein
MGSSKKFQQDKSFGLFYCDNCNYAWPSAHSFKKYTQQCEACKKHFLPTYMWKNDHRKGSNHHIDKELHIEKPHKTYLCSACKAGVCKVDRN